MSEQKQFYGMSHTEANPITKALQNLSFVLMAYQFNYVFSNARMKILYLFITQISSQMQKTLIKFALIAYSLLILSSCFTVKEAIQVTPETPSVSLSTKTKLIWPLPTKITLDETAEQSQIDPCTINYKIEANPSDYVKQMLNIYLIQIFKCKQIKPGSIQLNIVVKNANQMIAQQIAHEKYQITVRATQKWELVADYYVGFLRGLETFSQLFQKKNGKYVINGRPILIDDTPNYVWRGLMIDSSRHFLPVDTIKRTIDGLMYNKMSVLHWHITDQDSFPMVIASRPELSQYGKFSGTYSQAEIKSIINYAKVRGVRVIPQFDTPAHTQSWGRSQKYKNIVVKCNNEYQGQFDPTIDLTYQVVNDVMIEVNSTFTDSFVHFGGDEIVESCYSKKPSIKQWMDKNNITTYLQLSNYYRKRQKTMWRNISAFKKVIYWANEDIDMPVEADDVIHWWGVSKNVNKLAGRKNQVILSNYDLTYLDVGFGGRRGTGYGTFISWRDVYKFDPRVKDVNVIGGETCMWAETSNAEDIDQKVWTRSAVLNERLWNVGIDSTKDILNIVERLVAQTRRMKERGFKASPVTVGLCEKDPSICFGHG